MMMVMMKSITAEAAAVFRVPVRLYGTIIIRIVVEMKSRILELIVL